MPKTEPVEAVVAESPTGLDREVLVEVDRDSRSVVVGVGDSKAVLSGHELHEFKRALERAFLEVS